MAGATIPTRTSGNRTPVTVPEGGAVMRRRALEGHIVGAISLALALGLLWFVWLLARPIGLLLAAIILANALEPLADRLTRRMRRSVAISLIYVVLFALVAAVIGLVVPTITSQFERFSDDLPALLERAQEMVAQLGPLVGGLGSSGMQSATGGWSTVATLPLTIMSSVLEVVVVVFLSLYWLIALPTLRGFLLSLLPPTQVSETRGVLDEISQTTGGYVRGILIESALVGTIIFVAMWLIGVRYPGLLAVLAAFGEFVPYVGPIIAAVPAIVLALFESPTQALIVVALYLVLQILEGYVLFPLVVGSQSEIPPLLIIVGLLAGGALGGVLGALVAIPVAGALRVVVLRVVAPWLRRQTGGTERVLRADEQITDDA
jgi:predicted PurR-regulated permease PerM